MHWGVLGVVAGPGKRRVPSCSCKRTPHRQLLLLNLGSPSFCLTLRLGQGQGGAFRGRGQHLARSASRTFALLAPCQIKGGSGSGRSCWLRGRLLAHLLQGCLSWRGPGGTEPTGQPRGRSQLCQPHKLWAQRLSQSGALSPLCVCGEGVERDSWPRGLPVLTGPLT